MKAKITETLLNSLEANKGKVVVWDTEIAGFRVEMRTSGVISFIYSYRNAENLRQSYTLGRYGVLTVSKARKFATQKAAEAAMGVDIQAEKKLQRMLADQQRQQTLGTFYLEKYEQFLIAEKKTGSEIGQQIKNHFVDRWADKPLSGINSWLVTSWRNEKLKDGFTHGGVNRPVGYLKAMLNKAVEWGVIDKNPLAAFKKLKEDRLGVVRYLTKQEEDRLLVALEDRQQLQIIKRQRYIEMCSRRDMRSVKPLLGEFTDYLKPLILLALDTGLRKDELFSLQWKDVDLYGVNPTLTIRGSKTKSGNTRYIPLAERSYMTLSAWAKQSELFLKDDFVFKSPVTGKKLDNIQTSWERLLKHANISDFRFHDLRHTFASKLAMRGVSLYTIQQLLGHSSVEMTQRYAHLSGDHRVAAIRML